MRIGISVARDRSGADLYDAVPGLALMANGQHQDLFQAGFVPVERNVAGLASRQNELAAAARPRTSYERVAGQDLYPRTDRLHRVEGKGRVGGSKELEDALQVRQRARGERYFRNATDLGRCTFSPRASFSMYSNTASAG